MHAVGIAVMSLDGCLTRHDEPGTGFASQADQRFFREALASADCAIIGGGGYRAARDRIRAASDSRLLRVVLTRTPEAFSADALPDALEFRSDDPGAVIRDLAARGRTRCAVVGGSRLLTACLRDGLLDELWITIEPVAFGHGHRLVEGLVEFRFALTSVERFGGDTVLLRYRPERR